MKDNELFNLIFENNIEEYRNEALYLIRKKESSKKILECISEDDAYINSMKELYIDDMQAFLYNFLESANKEYEYQNGKNVYKGTLKEIFRQVHPDGTEFELFNFLFDFINEKPFFSKDTYRKITKNDFSDIVVFSNNLKKSMKKISDYIPNKLLLESDKRIYLRHILKEYFSVTGINNVNNTLFVFDFYMPEQIFETIEHPLNEDKFQRYLYHYYELFQAFLYMSAIRFCPVLFTVNRNKPYYGKQIDGIEFWADFTYKNSDELYRDIYYLLSKNKKIEVQDSFILKAEEK